MDILKVIGRETSLFDQDVSEKNRLLIDMLKGSKVLVIGAAGSIGQAVTLELFQREPKVLHAVDISENNMVELVRTIRSTIGYSKSEFKTFALDCGGLEFEALVKSLGPYDYIFNLSALKHVRSEKDPFTLMRLIQTNIFHTTKILRLCTSPILKKYFCVSTDKAANPVNLMGASKRIMEMYLMKESFKHNISMARFANVAFSDGSLLHGFNQRFAKRQPISAPNDVRRYFVTPKEAGELCLLSALLGENRDIFFPKLSADIYLETFSNIAQRYLRQLGFEPFECESEEEARHDISTLIAAKKWPVYFFSSDTTGEKGYEEFFTAKETLDLDRFASIGVILNKPAYDAGLLEKFEDEISSFVLKGKWDKSEIVDLFKVMIPDFDHKETGKHLDNRM